VILSTVFTENKALKAENKAVKSENVQLKFQLEQMKKLIFGSKSERFIETGSNTEQLNLFNTDTIEAQQAEALTEIVSYKRKKRNTKRKKHPGRYPFPDHLEVEEQIIEPDIETSQMTKIGEEVSEHLDYTQASLKRIRIIRPKYIDKASKQFHIAKTPQRALAKSKVSNALIAYILVSKFVDHLPFYRLAQMFKRQYNWQVDSQLMSHWLKGICQLLAPLYEVLKSWVRGSPYIQGDESPIKVLTGKAGKKNKKGKKLTQGYMWAYMAVELGLVLYDYQPGRSAKGPKAMLQNFKGYLQCDGYRVYNCIASLIQGIILVGCWAHLRRKFYDALKSEGLRANKALTIIQKIYHIEAKMKEDDICDYEQIAEIRQAKTKPLIEELKQWADEESIKVQSDSPIAVAITYLNNQWSKLIAVLEDGRLRLDNNLVENSFRALALGRKNYLFAGSHEGAKRIAMMYSFFASCKAQGINPYQWLIHTLDVIGNYTQDRLEELLPGYQK